MRNGGAGPKLPGGGEEAGLLPAWLAGGDGHKNGCVVDLLELSMPYAAREGWARKVEIWRHDGEEATLVQGAGKLPELCLLGGRWVLGSEVAEGDALRVDGMVWYRITGERYQAPHWGLKQELRWYWWVGGWLSAFGPAQRAESALDGVMRAEDKKASLEK